MNNGKLLYPLLALVSLFSGSLYSETSVWRVSQGANQLFIGGTIHILGAADYPLPAEFDRAYQRSDLLVLETDMEKLQDPDFQRVMMRALSYSDGRNLKSVLSAKTFQLLDNYCKSRGIPTDNLLPFKPGMVATTLTMLELQRLGLGGVGVDAYFNARAIKDRKKLGQLETVESQLAFISSMGQGQEDDLIAYTLEDINNLPALMGEMKQTWRKGDLSSLERVNIIPFKKDLPKIYQTMLVDRNNAWIPQIEAMLKTREVEFILVGALHLAGEDGLLEHLSKRGYEVEKL